MSLVFQNIDPPPPLPLASVSSPPTKAGGTHSPSGEGGGGSIFWKTRDKGLPSYSNNISMLVPMSLPLSLYRPASRARIFKLLRTPDIDSTESMPCSYTHGIDSREGGREDHRTKSIPALKT
jgi:hypothetical protein